MKKHSIKKRRIFASLLSISYSFLISYTSVSAIESDSTLNVLTNTEVKYLDSITIDSFPQIFYLEENDSVSLISEINQENHMPVKSLTISRIDGNAGISTILTAYKKTENNDFLQVDVPYTITYNPGENSAIIYDLESDYDVLLYSTLYYTWDLPTLFDLFLRPYQIELYYEYNSPNAEEVDFEEMTMRAVIAGDLFYNQDELITSSYMFDIEGNWFNLQPEVVYSATRQLPVNYSIRANPAVSSVIAASEYFITINGNYKHIMGNFYNN